MVAPPQWGQRDMGHNFGAKDHLRQIFAAMKPRGKTVRVIVVVPGARVPTKVTCDELD